MTYAGWPVATFSATNLDSGTRSPNLAREDLYEAVVTLLHVLESRGSVNGLCPLDASGKIPVSHLPVVPISLGGTGATNAAAARVALGINSGAVASGVGGSMAINFNGNLQTTTGANASIMQKTPLCPAAVTIGAAQVCGVDGLDGESGTTQIVISNKPYDQEGTADTIILSLAYNQTAVRVIGNIPIANNGTIYAYIKSVDGGHIGAQIIVEFV